MSNRSRTPAVTRFLVCTVMASGLRLVGDGQADLRDFMGSACGLLACGRVPPHGLEANTPMAVAPILRNQ